MAFCLQPRQGPQPNGLQRKLWEGSLGRGHPEREVHAGQGQGALTGGTACAGREAGCCTENLDTMMLAWDGG